MLSIWTVATFHYLGLNWIYHHTKLMELSPVEVPHLNIRRQSRILGIGCAVALMIACVFYWIMTAFIVNDPLWEANIKLKCPDFFSKHYDTIDRFYHGYTLGSFGQIGYLVGAY